MEGQMKILKHQVQIMVHRDQFTVDPITGCWQWHKSVEKYRYPSISVNGKWISVIRAFYAECYGPIPDGMLCCHRCDDNNCVNPHHIFLGTDRDNYHDSLNKKRRPLASNRKLSKEQIESLRGKTIQEAHQLANQYGITPQHALRMRRGLHWSSNKYDDNELERKF